MMSSAHKAHKNFAEIEALHQSLRKNYAEEGIQP